MMVMVGMTLLLMCSFLKSKNEDWRGGLRTTATAGGPKRRYLLLLP